MPGNVVTHLKDATTVEIFLLFSIKFLILSKHSFSVKFDLLEVKFAGLQFLKVKLYAVKFS